jgi:thioester reductase-like protein
MSSFGLISLVWTVVPALVAVWFYRYVRPERDAWAHRWAVHQERVRRSDGCQRCGRRVWPGESIMCCPVCEPDMRWCLACHGADRHPHAMVREAVNLEVDPSRLDAVHSVPEALLVVFDLYAPRPCLGQRFNGDGEFTFLAYADVGKRARALASHLLARHSVGSVVWLMASPMSAGPARFIAQYGALLAGMLVVPLHASTTAAALSAIAQRAPPRCVIAERRFALPAFADDIELLDVEAAGSFVHAGGALDVAPFANKPDRFVMLLPSSGSTGVPKLTIVTDAMLSGQIVVPRLGADHCILASMSELNQTLDILCKGGRIGCASSLESIGDDLRALRPTVHGATPVFWSGLKARYNEMVAAAAGDAGRALEQFRALKLLGNRCQIVIVGGAKCSPELKEFIWQAFEVPVVDGFGATEVGGLASNGNVSDAVELRLIDAPDIGFLTSDSPPRGEIVARSNRITPGYYGDADETARNFCEIDGVRFFRTGDVGILENRRVTVIDRRGALCKLAQGVFVAPTFLEGCLEAEREIAGAFVYGNSDMYSVAAVVKAAPGCTRGDVLAAVARAAAKFELKPHERPANVVIDDSDWSELYQSIGKKQRARCAERFKARLTAPPDVVAATASSAGANTLASLTAQLINAHIPSVIGRAAALPLDTSLSECGADSLSLARLGAAIREQTGHEIAVGQLARLTLGALQSVLLGGASLAAALSASSAFDWLAEAEAAVLRVPPLDAAPTSATRRGACVFLTGCTGFVGAFLLRAALDEEPTCSVVCHVRADSDEAARQRIVSTMAQYDRPLSARDLERVVALRGDLAKPRLGLDDWDGVVARLQRAARALVVHSGASVSSAASFGSLRHANVDAALWALRLAEASASRLCHVSSVGFLSGQREELPVDPARLASINMLSGYAQSKCVAELALQKAEPRAPLLVVRCGTVSGAADGATNASDSVMRLLLGVAVERVVVLGPRSPFPQRFAMLPVDTTASAILGMCRAELSGVVHLLCRRQIAIELLVQAVRAHGVDVVDMADDVRAFRERVRAADSSSPWFAIKSVLAAAEAGDAFLSAADDDLPFNDRARALGVAVDVAPTVDEVRAQLAWLLRKRQ